MKLNMFLYLIWLIQKFKLKLIKESIPARHDVHKVEPANEYVPAEHPVHPIL